MIRKVSHLVNVEPADARSRTPQPERAARVIMRIRHCIPHAEQGPARLSTSEAARARTRLGSAARPPGKRRQGPEGPQRQHGIPKRLRRRSDADARRLPKRGFTNAASSKESSPVNLGDVDARFDGAEVDIEALRSRASCRARRRSSRSSATGLHQEAHDRTRTLLGVAKEKIEKAGGKAGRRCSRSPSEGEPKAEGPSKPAGLTCER